MVGIAVGSGLAAVAAAGASMTGLMPLPLANAVGWGALASICSGVMLGSTQPGLEFFGPAIT